MLRRSAETTNREAHLRAITDDSVTSGIRGGRQLLAFADALVARDPAAVTTTGAALAGEVGDATAARAAAVCGNFQMMNRILDATGVPVPPGRRDLVAEIGIDPDTFGGAHGF